MKSGVLIGIGVFVVALFVLAFLFDQGFLNSLFPMGASGLNTIQTTVQSSTVQPTTTIVSINNTSTVPSSTTIPQASLGLLNWQSTTPYPINTTFSSCVASDGYVYCIGGESPNDGAYLTSAYYASLTSEGIGSWYKTTSYPIDEEQSSCVVNDSDIYCVGGYNNSESISSVYYAPLSSNGIGNWEKTSTYPISVLSPTCVVNSNYIYCIAGGINSGWTNRTYYAPITSNGIGTWIQASSYPIGLYGHSCVVNSSNVYCVGGSYGNGGNTTRVVYSAHLSSNGISPWNETTWYPQYISNTNCNTYQGYILCIGGSAIYSGEAYSIQNFSYYAPVSINGIGNWTQTTSYPKDLPFGSCVTYSGYVYCFGMNFYIQEPQAAYYSSLLGTQ